MRVSHLFRGRMVAGGIWPTLDPDVVHFGGMVMGRDVPGHGHFSHIWPLQPTMAILVVDPVQIRSGPFDTSEPLKRFHIGTI